MVGYQNGTGSRNSGAIQMAYKSDGLTDAERNAVRNALLKNATGVANKTVLTWSGGDWAGRNSPYLVRLPADMIKAVPLVSWYSCPSHPENLSAPRPLRDSDVAGLK